MKIDYPKSRMFLDQIQEKLSFQSFNRHDNGAKIDWEKRGKRRFIIKDFIFNHLPKNSSIKQNTLQILSSSSNSPTKVP